VKFVRFALPIIVIAFVAGGVFWWKFGYPGLQSASVSDAVAAPAASSVAELIVGTWTSTDDASYKITFSADMTLSEQYGTSTVTHGTYSFAASPAGYVGDEVDTPSGQPNDYLLQEIDGERYAYRVVSVTPERLELSYLERGNTLSFTR
jgi:hypothetical protein